MTQTPPEVRYSERAGFLMGNPDREVSRGLTLLIIGKADRAAFAALARRLPDLHVREVDLAPSVRFEAHPGEMNAALDSANSHWIFILRAGETIPPALADEIAASAVEPPLCWGFRVPTRRLYRGKPLHGHRDGGGEIRLLHRRHARFDMRLPGTPIKVQGTVLRTKNALDRLLYATAGEHRESLELAGVPHSLLRRILIFLRRAWTSGSWWRSLNSLIYLWIEAGYDRGPSRT